MKTPTAKPTIVRRRIPRLAALLLLTAVSAFPVGSRADEKSEAVDARLESYQQAGNLPDPGGTVPTWMFFGVLSVMVVGVLFMNAKRTHLD